MKGRHQSLIKAKPASMRFREAGYELTVEITEGPKNMIGRIVKVTFSAK